MRFGRDDEGNHCRTIEIIKFEIWRRIKMNRKQMLTHLGIYRMEEKNKKWEMERGREILIYVHIYMFTYTKHGRIMSPLLCHILFLIFICTPSLLVLPLVPYSPFFIVPWSSNQFTFTSPHIVDCLLIWCCPQGWEGGMQ